MSSGETTASFSMKSDSEDSSPSSTGGARDRVFVASRKLAFMRHAHYLTMALSTNTELKTALLSAIVLVQPKFPVPKESLQLVQQYLPFLQKKVTPAIMEQLGTVAAGPTRHHGVNRAQNPNRIVGKLFNVAPGEVEEPVRVGLLVGGRANQGESRKRRPMRRSPLIQGIIRDAGITAVNQALPEGVPGERRLNKNLARLFLAAGATRDLHD